MNSVSIPFANPDEPFDFAAYQEALRAQERQRVASALAPLGVLPPRPDLAHYKRVVKERLRHRREVAPDARLSLVQDELARENGFPNWPRLAHAVSERKVRANEFGFVLGRRDDAAVLSALEFNPAPVVDVALAATYEDLSYLTSVARYRSEAIKETICIVGFALATWGKSEGLATRLEALQLQYFDFDWHSASTVISERRIAAEVDPKHEHEIEGFEEALSVLATFEEIDPTDGPFDMD